MVASIRPRARLKAFFREEFYGNRWILLVCLLFTGVVCMFYPLSLIVEFWDAPGGHTLELFKLYPHMALIPPLLYWAIFWIAGSAVSAAWSDKSVRGKIKWCAILSLIVSAGLTYQEATSSPLMLFELRPDRGSDSTWSTLYKHTRDMLDRPQPQTLPLEETQEQLAMGEALSYDYWRNERRFSISRPFYIAAFFLSVFALLTAFAAAFHIPPKWSQHEKDRYLYYLLGAFFCYALWFPARFYFNLEVKSTLVGPAERLPGRDIILYMIGAGFLVFVCVHLISHIDRLRKIAGLVVLFVLPIVSVFASKSLGNVFGLRSNPMTWFALFSAFLYLFIGFRSVLPSRHGTHKTRRREAHGT